MLKLKIGLPALAVVAAVSWPLVVTAGGTAPRYQLVDRIAGPDGLWDYASVDAGTRHLYVGKKGGLVSLDLATPNAKPVMLFKSIVVHQALPFDSGRLIATGGPSDQAFILDGKSGALLATIATGKDPDAVAFDRKTRRAVTFNRGDSSATVIDVDRASVVATISLPSKAEFPIGDGAGLVYVNLEHAVAVIDVAQAKIVRTYPLGTCEDPTGLALDKRTTLLISACGNGFANIMTTAGRQVARLKVGPEPDAAFVDERRRVAFIPSGATGTLSVISLANPHAPKVVQTLTTQPEARTGAVDPATGTVYLPVGKLLPPATGEKWPSVVPGTFQLLVVRPRS